MDSGAVNQVIERSEDAVQKKSRVECDICYRRFSATKRSRQPMVGQCGHSFCRLCAKHLRGKCAHCRANIRPKKNFTLLESLEQQEKMKKNIKAMREQMKQAGLPVEEKAEESEESDEEEEEAVEEEVDEEAVNEESDDDEDLEMEEEDERFRIDNEFEEALNAFENQLDNGWDGLEAALHALNRVGGFRYFVEQEQEQQVNHNVNVGAAPGPAVYIQQWNPVMQHNVPLRLPEVVEEEEEVEVEAESDNDDVEIVNVIEPHPGAREDAHGLNEDDDVQIIDVIELEPEVRREAVDPSEDDDVVVVDYIPGQGANAAPAPAPTMDMVPQLPQMGQNIGNEGPLTDFMNNIAAEQVFRTALQNLREYNELIGQQATPFYPPFNGH